MLYTFITLQIVFDVIIINFIIKDRKYTLQLADDIIEVYRLMSEIAKRLKR